MWSGALDNEGDGDDEVEDEVDQRTIDPDRDYVVRCEHCGYPIYGDTPYIQSTWDFSCLHTTCAAVPWDMFTDDMLSECELVLPVVK